MALLFFAQIYSIDYYYRSSVESKVTQGFLRLPGILCLNTARICKRGLSEESFILHVSPRSFELIAPKAILPDENSAREM